MKKYIFFIFSLLVSISYGQVFYNLKVNVLTQNGEIESVTHIYSDKPEDIKIDLQNLDVYAVIYGKEKLLLNKKVFSVKISPDKDLQIKYRKKFLDFTSENIITDEAISLLGRWYPIIDKLAVYSLEAEVQKGFILISEYENL